MPFHSLLILDIDSSIEIPLSRYDFIFFKTGSALGPLYLTRNPPDFLKKPISYPGPEATWSGLTTGLPFGFPFFSPPVS